MRFGNWYPLSAAGAHAPEHAGVYQLRIPDGLIAYPNGKSAMIHYGVSSNLRRAVTELCDRHAGPDWLCRHTVVADDPQALLATLLERFEQRFGAPPTLPT